MSITDELREYFKTAAASPAVFKELTDIADRIDEKHAKLRDKAYNDGVCDGIDADKNAMGYVKLPVDADGEIWTGNERVFEVESGTRYDMRYLMYDGEKWIIDSSFGGFIANECHHVQPDSWERIIQDAVKLGYADYPTTCYEAELVKRCKRLAGE